MWVTLMFIQMCEGFIGVERTVKKVCPNIVRCRGIIENRLKN